MSVMETTPETEAADSWEAISTSGGAMLQDEGQDGLVAAVSDVQEENAVALLPHFDDEKLRKLLQGLPDTPRRGHVKKELTWRLAARLDDESLKSLWRLLVDSLKDAGHDWIKAAACVLAKHMDRLDPDLRDLGQDLLSETCAFLRDQEAAATFATDSFKVDLGISAAEQWPQEGAARVFVELARRLEDKSDEKLQLLKDAYNINKTDSSVRASLRELLLLHDRILCQGDEGLLLELTLEGDRDIPQHVLANLALSPHDLSQLSPKQRLRLADQLGRSNRKVDGARVAVEAARALATDGLATESKEAFLKALDLDPSNPHAAGAIALVAQQRCEGLERRSWMMRAAMTVGGAFMLVQNWFWRGRLNELKKSQAQAEEQAQDRFRKQEERCEVLEQDRDQLKERLEQIRRQIEERHKKLWDLSSYDFSRFEKGQAHLSEKFQLPGGINAWMELYPKGDAKSSEGKAGLYLYVDKPAVVKWTMQSGSSEAKTLERDFSKELNADGTPQGWGNANFMPISEANGRITLYILSCEPTGSTLRSRL